jgi:hypothetical protein
MAIQIESSAFSEGGPIPRQYIPNQDDSIAALLERSP